MDFFVGLNDCFSFEFMSIFVEVCYMGFMLLIFDVDGDGDWELILGDVLFDVLNYFINEGDCGMVWMGI